MLTTLSFQEYMDDDLDVLVQNKGIETEQDPDLDLDQELLFDQDDQYQIKQTMFKDFRINR